MKREHGFTLLEVLLATSLLAAAMALAFATVRAAGASVQRGEALAERNERIRAVSTFLRRRIGGANGIVFGLDPASGEAQRFVGDAQRMEFVADLPSYLGRGGPHLHVLTVDGQGLRVDFRMVMAGSILEVRDPRPPEELAGHLRAVEFAYRGVSRDGSPGTWVGRWEHAGALPQQVRVRIADGQGPWPDMIVTLPLAASYGAPPEAVP